MAKKNKKEFKVVELKIDELDLNTGVNAMALTDDPAIEIMGVLMKKESERFFAITEIDSGKKKLHFSDDDSAEHIITGPCMVPNMKIFRIDPISGEEFYAFFSEETVKIANQNFVKVGGPVSVNWDHESYLPGTFISESWLVADPDNDKASALGFEGLPKGTWMITMKIDSIDVWKKLKEKECGFSIEGFFNFKAEAKKKEAEAKVEETQKLTEKEMIESVKTIFDSKETEDEKLAIIQRIMEDCE